MCRLLAYLGETVPLEDLLYASDSSFVHQSVEPRLMTLLNLGGFGAVAWDAASRRPDRPWVYRTPSLPIFDRNLRALAHKADASALLAHVRGVSYDEEETVGAQNVHPFHFPGTPVAMVMNGTLDRFSEMRFDLLRWIGPQLAQHIEGTTDTEWIYALVLSGLRDPSAPDGVQEVAAAAERALGILRDVRAARGIDTQSPVNMALSDGTWLVATRFTYDYGWYQDASSFFGGEREYDYTTLWFAAGSAYGKHDGAWTVGSGDRITSLVLASEPLTLDRSRWLEVPEYAMLVADRAGDELRIETRELGI